MLRQSISQQKKVIGGESLACISKKIILQLEQTELFRKANTILAYYSLPLEVETREAIERWSESKTILLPIVVGEELELKLYDGNETLKKGSFNVMEPTGVNYTDFDSIDLVIVPGVAFDRNKFRMGYGKGFYDKLLPKIGAKKAGICFDFQLFEQIPADAFDQAVDIILTEREIVL